MPVQASTSRRSSGSDDEGRSSGSLVSLVSPAAAGTVPGRTRAAPAAERRRVATGAELAQAAFTAIVAAFLVLTLIGVFFRGPGMALAWPGTPTTATEPPASTGAPP